MAKPDWGDILKKKRLKFKSNKELKEYYENKYKKEGYKGGFKLHGINISNVYHKARQNSALKYLSPKKDEFILDAGCGKGDLTLRIAKRCKKVYGVDISKNAFRKIEKKRIKNLVFLKMNIEKLKFKNKFFDKIVCVETLEHVLHPKKVLREFSRVIKPGGILVITYPTINKTVIKKIEFKLKIEKPLSVSEHLSEWDYDKLIRMVERNGFKFVKGEGIVFDFGKIKKLKELSKVITRKMTEIELFINKFPKNSMFISLVFEKN